MATQQSQTISRFMARDTVTISTNATLREALDVMAENQVSGLPVLAADDRCVGVISASDILLIEHEHNTRDTEALGSYFDPDNQKWEHVRIAREDETLDDIAVTDVMSRELASVLPNAPLNDVAQAMVTWEVHRILVLDGDGLLHGVVSAYDFVNLWATECPEVA